MLTPELAEDSLIRISGSPATARDLVVLVPGALTTHHVFDDYLAQVGPDTAVISYRFPGMDGRPRDGKVRIAEAGAIIAARVNALPARHVRLIGLSTGGPISIEAARRIHRDLVEVGILSSALPAPATILSMVPTTFDVTAAAGRAGSVRRSEVWAEYYRTLLFGRPHYADPVLSARSARMADAVRNRLQLPGGGMARSHGGDLLHWTLTHPEELAHARILFLHGQDDPLFPARGVARLSARLPQSKVIIYPHSGHLLFATQTRLFDDLRAAFETWKGD